MKIGWSQIRNKIVTKLIQKKAHRDLMSLLLSALNRFFPLSFALKGVSGSGGRTIKAYNKAVIKAFNKA